MVFIVLSRFFATFTPVGYYDEEKNAQELVNKLQGETFIEEDADVKNINSSTCIYTIIMGGLEELHFISFDGKEAETKLKELNVIDEKDRTPEDGPPEFYLRKIEMNKHLLEAIKVYDEIIQAGFQPMTFDRNMNTIPAELPNVEAAEQITN